MHPLFHQFALGLLGILPGNYSAITPVADGVYAIVDDKDSVDGFQLLYLDFHPRSGRLKKASVSEPVDMTIRRERRELVQRDCEGICFNPYRQTIFISGETDQQILEYDLNGFPTGQGLKIPDEMGKNCIKSNCGFEALTYDTLTHLFWTTTENSLRADSAGFIRLVAFGDDLMPAESYLYQLDSPQSIAPSDKSTYGVPAILAVGDGRLLVMERNVVQTTKKSQSYVTICIYIVDPASTTPFSTGTDFPPIDPAKVLPKRLLTSITTRVTSSVYSFANYEGMCWGPVLSNGRRTILLLADSQCAYGNRLYHLKDYLATLVLREDL